MKNLKQTTGWIIAILFAMFAVSFASCDSSDDDDTEREISGDSKLVVINTCSWSCAIYFDNDFIGDVTDDTRRTWSVPTGVHTVKVSAEKVNSISESYTFVKGESVIITVYQKEGSAPFLHTEIGRDLENLPVKDFEYDE